jgi:FtsP/CotA-like multicopper oxidase with cupredoxin domain
MSPLVEAIARRRLLSGAGAAAVCFTVPRRLRAETAPDGFRIVRARPAAPGTEGQTSGWAYDGAVPGPALRVKRGEELRVRLVNELPEPTTIHWHGLRLPNAMDGVPLLTQPPIAAGASFDYRFRPPDAGTFLYHAYLAEQSERGLYGALTVEEPDPVGVDRDIVLLLASGEPGGAAVRVNGALRPDIAVKRGERLRLRLINASAARGLVLKLDGHVPWVMALDGQPAEPFVARDGRLGLAPGGRADLFVDMIRAPSTIAPLLAGVRDEQAIARLVYESGGEARTRSDPPALPSNPLPARIDLKGSLRVELPLAGPKPIDPAGAPIFTVKRGRAVTLAIRNPTGQPQVVHLHGHSFRLLDRLDDGWKPYWLDTMVVGEQTERIAFVADNPGKWLIASRPLEQRGGAAGWFAVT